MVARLRNRRKSNSLVPTRGTVTLSFAVAVTLVVARFRNRRKSNSLVPTRGTVTHSSAKRLNLILLANVKQ